MKKLLIGLPLLALALGYVLVSQRMAANPEGTMPLPYRLAPATQKIAVEAPLLITGDRMAQRFGLFKEVLSLEVSQGLSKPLKTGVLAQETHAMHRTLHQMENLETWPKVIIYTGGSVEFLEERFLTTQIPTVRRNFQRYQDDTWRTLMMLWPPSARLIYDPLTRVELTETVTLAPEKPEPETQARLELTLKLFEMELTRFVELARKNGALLILMTAPVNLDVAPKKVCSEAVNQEITQEIAAIRQLIRQQDYKAAYPRSKSLVETSLANAEVLYLHGQVAYRAGAGEEARDALRRAAAFDCRPWRATEITNNIIRQVAQVERVTLFDFAAMVEADWNQNSTFFDEIYPQDLYYEQSSKALAVVLKRLLKL